MPGHVVASFSFTRTRPQPTNDLRSQLQGVASEGVAGFAHRIVNEFHIPV